MNIDFKNVKIAKNIDKVLYYNLYQKYHLLTQLEKLTLKI